MFLSRKFHVQRSGVAKFPTVCGFDRVRERGMPRPCMFAQS